MEITISQEQGRAAVSVIRVSGQLDGRTYLDLISKANEIIGTGAKNILLDLSDLTFISSAGLVALHTIALLSRGDTLPNPKHGLDALKTRIRDEGLQEYLKLLNPRPEVAKVLDMVGFSNFFEVFTDRQKAVNSF